MTRSESIKFLILRSIGNFLVLFAIFGIFATFGPALGEEAKFRIGQARGVRYRVRDVQQSQRVHPWGGVAPAAHPRGVGFDGGFAAIITGPKEQVLIAKDPQFSILIPKIGVSEKVIANVDSGKEEEFLPVLQEGVAHAKGTVFPGMKGNVYLFAHSTDNFWNVGRYNAVFYLLKDLEKNDEVVVFFEGRRHNYTVSDSKIVDPEDVSYLTKSQKGGEVLVLQSCWPPGTTWKRLIVLASPK